MEKTIYVKNRELLIAYENWLMEGHRGQDIDQFLASLPPQQREETGWVRVEDVAELIPSNWLDPLLSGKNRVVGEYPLSDKDIENLMNALRKRILEYTPPSPVGDNK